MHTPERNLPFGALALSRKTCREHFQSVHLFQTSGTIPPRSHADFQIAQATDRSEKTGGRGRREERGASGRGLRGKRGVSVTGLRGKIDARDGRGTREGRGKSESVGVRGGMRGVDVGYVYILRESEKVGSTNALRLRRAGGRGCKGWGRSGLGIMVR